MGHFGKQPVRLAWFTLVWPGTAAQLLRPGRAAARRDEPVANPFFCARAAGSVLPLLVVLATAATMIASQATISGAFSVTRQAVQLDLLPRVHNPADLARRARARSTCRRRTLFMFVAVVGVRARVRQSSSALSAAYGASVIGTMLITTLLGAVVAQASWQWPTWRIVAVFGLFLLVDIAFVPATSPRSRAAAGCRCSLAAIMFMVFETWRDGRARLRAELAAPRGAVDRAAEAARGRDARCPARPCSS